VVDGVVEALKIVTRGASERIMRFAFEYARHRGRKRLCILHKASVMRLSDGLFLECARRVAEDYPYLEVEHRAIDKVFLELVLDPSRYDMLVTGNLDGDLLSDLCAGLVGGLGVVPGANLGDRCAVFEAVHGTAPELAGKDLANPTALILSAELMLRHIGEIAAAERLRAAVEGLLASGQSLTRDLGGSASTTAMTAALERRLGRDSAAPAAGPPS
jgi:isocitrate dehydrogenase (NAD+)